MRTTCLSTFLTLSVIAISSVGSKDNAQLIEDNADPFVGCHVVENVAQDGNAQSSLLDVDEASKVHFYSHRKTYLISCPSDFGTSREKLRN
ncbi:MAG: hypothetical protein MHMPM18_002204 [Marteilia pararefringens]